MSLRFPIIRRVLLAVLLLASVTSCSMASFAYSLAPGMAVRYVDDYLNLSRQQELEAKRLFIERQALHERDELPRYHALLADADAAIRDGIKAKDVEAIFEQVRELYRLAVKRTIPQVATILADASESQIDTLASRLEREAEEDRKEMKEDDFKWRDVDETLEDVEDWTGSLRDEQRRLLVRYIRKMEITRPYWLEWRIERNQQLVALLRSQASRKEIETFLGEYWIERAGIPRYLEEGLETNRRLYREMIVALDASLTPEQREKARERVAEFQEMVLDMMPQDVRLAVLEKSGGTTRGHASQ